MITLCGHCSVDSAGNHEWGCPCSPQTYPGPQADDVVLSLHQHISTLKAQLSAVTATLTATREEAADRIAKLQIRLAEVQLERDKLQKHYDEAGPEHNLLDLLDLYDQCRRDAEHDAKDVRADLRAVVEALRTVNPWCTIGHRHDTCDIGKVQMALARPGIRALEATCESQ